VHGGEPGLARRRRGRGVVYLDPGGERVRDPETLSRIEALGIPPAWGDVWIATLPNAHLQATGIDSKGRRQYLYHPAWRRRRDIEKFDDMLEFARRLPALRGTARRLLADTGSERPATLALAIRLLDVGFFRVGWDRYARDNGHVGLATLRRDQVTLRDAAVHFDFVAKSGKRRRMTVRDPQSVRALRPLKRRRGEPAELLAYRSGAGWRRIHAPDVNNALRCWGKGPYSAKEFRTWEATVLAAVALAREHEAGRRGPKSIPRAVREVSTALGNTPQVARDSYIDPRVIESYQHGAVIDLSCALPDAAVTVGIDAGDDGVVIELPTRVDGDELRLEVERRVLDLLSGERPPRSRRPPEARTPASAPTPPARR
jgi:DNA topoisomerase-1